MLVTAQSLPQQSARERIVEAARLAFEAQGFDATRVEDLLRRAEVSRPTFYRLFANKHEVYQQLHASEAPLERTALERVREGCREAFGQLGYEGARVDDLIAASGVARSTFYRIFRNKEDAFVQLDCAAVEYLRRAIRRAASQPEAPPDGLRFTAGAYVEWRAAVRRSTVTLEHDPPAPRHPLAQWRSTSDMQQSLPYPEREPDVGALPAGVLAALVVGVDRIARGSEPTSLEERSAQVLSLITAVTGARLAGC